MVVFFTQIIENTYAKGRALMQLYEVVLQTKRGNRTLYTSFFSGLITRKTYQKSSHEKGKTSM